MKYAVQILLLYQPSQFGQPNAANLDTTPKVKVPTYFHQITIIACIIFI